MKKIIWKKSLFLGLLLGCLWLLQSAYVVDTLDNVNRSHRFWSTGDFPIQIQIWEGFTDQLPSIVDGSSPKVALREALERWARVTSLTITLGPDTSTTDVNTSQPDGINLVTISDTQNNRNAVGQAAGKSLSFSFSTGQILEADVILNPANTWSTLETDDFNINNIFQVALHEFGHNWNLNHSISRTSTLFFSGTSFDFGFNALSWDDVSGASVTYPMVGLDLITGTITGTVTRDGNPVFGAFVVAVDDQGVLASNAITLPDGTYKLEFLPPGNYTLYVEPLDSPTTPASVSGGIFDQPMVTDFLPKFFNDSQTPSVTVNAGATTAARDFAVSQGNSAIDPFFLGQTLNPNSGFSVSAKPAEANQGVNTNVIVAGTGVDTLAGNQGVFFLSNNLITGTVAREGNLSNGDPFKIYPVIVPLDTPKGEYPMLLQSASGETGVISGGLELFSPFHFLQAFAQFADIQGITSGLFLINTNLSGNATGKISARIGADQAAAIGVDPGSRTAISLGSLTADANGDLDFGLGPGGALSVKTEVDGQFVGSLRAEADRRLGGTVLFESQFGTTGVGPSRPLYTFIAPIEFKGGGTSNTGLAITNLDERPAKVFIQVQDQNGNALGNTIIDLDGNGHVARFINQLLTGLPTDFDGSAVVTANRKIGGTVIATGPGVFTTFPAIQNRIFTRSFFAQFAHVAAANFSSELILVNPSPIKAATVTLQVRDSNGANASVTLSGEILPQGNKIVSIPSLGSVVLQTQSDIVGSVEVNTQDMPVGGVVLFSSPTVGTAGVGESFPQTDFVLPIDRNTSSGIDTGIAVVNTTDQQVLVTVLVRDQNGNTVSQTQINLAPRQQLAKFPNEDPLSLNLPDTFTGSLWVQANRQVAATVIRQSPGVLTTFPVIPLAQFITPAD
ncbi:matrixin family metalloprotease [Acidobacteria bacterium AH-259-O06]|nr:matrixin family metalloprotease [Acidobacteria bacterium AH-259-O06]